jgi:hypothetical protein
MQKYQAILITLLCSATTMYGATTTTQRAPSSHDLTQEREQKIHHQSQESAFNSKTFWESVIRYNEARENPNNQAALLELMLEMLNKNRTILSSCQNNVELVTEKNNHKIFECYPLKLAAVLAYDSTPDTAQRRFFKSVAHLDPDYQHQLDIIRIGIGWNSYYLVEQMVSVGTNIRHAPHIMKQFVDACESVHNTYLEASKKNDNLPTSLTAQDLFQAYPITCNLYRALKGKHNLIEIRDLLLDADVDLSYVALNLERPHFKEGNCLSCKSIVRKLENQSGSHVILDITDDTTPNSSTMHLTLSLPASSKEKNSCDWRSIAQKLKNALSLIMKMRAGRTD